MKASCDGFESEIEVSGNSDSYFSDGSHTETIDSVAPNEFLGNSDSRYWKPLHAGNESVNESLQKTQRETVSLHKVYTPAVRNTLTEYEAL